MVLMFRKSDVRASRLLGWTSLLIGMTEMLFPKKIEQTMGVRPGEKTGVLRVLGMREMATGLDILTHRNPRPGIMARVVGDVLDGAVLVQAARKSQNKKGLAAIIALVTPVVLADLFVAGRLMRAARV
jgi:hypothetical protein